MKHAKKAGKLSLFVGLCIYFLPVVLGLWLSRHAHRKIQHPVLKYLAIAAIMLPSLFAGQSWAAAMTASSSPAFQSTGQFSASLPKPKVEKKLITQEQPVPFEDQTVNDANLPSGQTAVRQEGKPGVKTVTIQITLQNGKEVGRARVNEELNTPPLPKITAVGTKASTPIIEPVATALRSVATPVPPAPTVAPQSSQCDPNYTPCVPIASDVDCLGGGGNGPAYVKGPVRVIGTDIYKLDSNHDGWGCEN